MPTSNTAILRRTERSIRSARISARQAATAIAAVILTILIVSFRPFQPASEAVEGGGDIVNQLGFGTLGAVALLSMLALADRRVLTALLSPWWLLLLLFLGLSVLNAADPASAGRAAAFTVMGIIAVAAVLTLPRDAEAFSSVLVFAGFSVVGLSYVGLVLYSDVAIHGAGGFEPQHAGFWRGVFSHKNIAGPVMACFSFAGLYLFRRGRRTAGGLLFVAALFFMSNTGSKTTAGLVPLAILLVAAPGVIGMRFLTPLLIVTAILGTALVTLGIVFIEPLGELAASWFPDLTYTGRTTLWAFGGEMLARQPWTGYGYESFWGTPTVTEIDRSFDLDWDIRGIVHGHNGYLDIAILMGVPALCTAIVAFIVAPLRDYVRVPPLRENIYLADFLMMIALFTLLNAFLESFFFRRADPVWLLFVMSALGLRLVARFKVATRLPG